MGRDAHSNGAADQRNGVPRRPGRHDPVWLFPASYVLHLAEEYAAGGGFPLWLERALGIGFTKTEFLAWNAFALALMCVGAWLVAGHPRFRFVEIAMAVAVLGNVAAHATASLLTWTYSPGLVTGLVLWGPLGAIRLRSARLASTPRARRAGTYIGLSAVLIATAIVALGTIVRR